MDRGDADQEGITLPPVSTFRLVARDEAQKAVIQHLSLCPIAADNVVQRLRDLENRVFLLIGLMIGSGLLGGTTGAILTKIFTR